MKKQYIAPESFIMEAKAESVLKAGSIGNYGEKYDKEGNLNKDGFDNWQTGIPDNNKKDIEVDAKRNNWGDIWED